MDILVSWVGSKDAEISSEMGSPDSAPLSTALLSRHFDGLVCLLDKTYDRKFWDEAFVPWATSHSLLPPVIEVIESSVSNPTDYSAIFPSAKAALDFANNMSANSLITVHTSPGTAVMQTVWVLLSFQYENIKLIQSSEKAGVEQVDLPFAAEYAFKDKSLIERLAGLADTTPDTHGEIAEIPGESPAIKQAKRLATRFAALPYPKLLLGETGTGKEVFANAMHRAWSNASGGQNKQFSPINCGAIPPDLIDSTLFGSVKGAYTGSTKDTAGLFEACNGGTVFLDEVGELPLNTQARLLRVLQEFKITRVGDPKEIEIPRFNLISATHRDLRQMISNGSFREDLYQRLAYLTVELPPLRLRSADLRDAIDSILSEVAQEAPETIGKRLSENALEFAEAHSWPGNYRELRRVIVRAAVLSETEIISKQEITDQIEPAKTNQTGFDEQLIQVARTMGLPVAAEAFKRMLIERHLKETGDNQEQTANAFGVKQSTISRLLKASI